LPKDLDQKLQESFFAKDRSLIHDWMLGKYTDREVNKLISEKLNVPFDYLWKLFVNDCKNMTVPIQTLEKISSLRDKFILILITVNTDSFTAYTSKILNLEKYFDYISNSYCEKKHKNTNGGELFVKYAKKFNSPISKSFLIDDKESICQTFRLLSGTAYQVDEKKDINYYLDILIEKFI
jgi:hypothetical protein